MREDKTISDFLKKYPKCLRTIYYSMDGSDIDSITLTNDTKKFEHRFLRGIGLDVELVEYLFNLTPEEREDLGRQSKIAYHKKEIEKIKAQGRSKKEKKA